jgi:hypothetical protein
MDIIQIIGWNWSDPAGFQVARAKSRKILWKKPIGNLNPEGRTFSSVKISGQATENVGMGEVGQISMKLSSPSSGT